MLVDGLLRTSAPGIFAAGDVANQLHPRLGRLRVEHWDNALHQGPAAARSMLDSAESYERLPYFFSDQYDVGMEYSGHATSWDRVLFRGDPATREFIAFWLAGGRVVAGMNVNVWDVAEPIRALIASRRRGRRAAPRRSRRAARRAVDDLPRRNVMTSAVTAALRPIPFPTSGALRGDPVAHAFGLLLGALTLARLASAFGR